MKQWKDKDMTATLGLVSHSSILSRSKYQHCADKMDGNRKKSPIEHWCMCWGHFSHISTAKLMCLFNYVKTLELVQEQISYSGLNVWMITKNLWHSPISFLVQVHKTWHMSQVQIIWGCPRGILKKIRVCLNILSTTIITFFFVFNVFYWDISTQKLFMQVSDQVSSSCWII